MTPESPARLPADAGPASASMLESAITQAHGLMARIPESAIALLSRFSVAAVFWKSGQTKIEGLAIDIVSGTFEVGLPRLSSSAVDGRHLPKLLQRDRSSSRGIAPSVYDLILFNPVRSIRAIDSTVQHHTAKRDGRGRSCQGRLR
jgi:hypothetical protein